MAKQGEIDYLKNIGEASIVHAARKPWSDDHCNWYLMQMGAVMTLFPPRPARILDIGCGTGWTSVFFAKARYEVVGLDIAPDMIRLANENKAAEGLENLSFICADYEESRFDQEFDVAVFCDSLHHAIDELKAVEMAYRALRPGGICIASEPGKGHSQSPDAIDHVRRFNVTEKDMPPGKIWSVGRKAGFRNCRVFPHAQDLAEAMYRKHDRNWARPFRRTGVLRTLRLLMRMPDSGLVMMRK
jgi:SAM-dependent methyltransferase